MRLLYFQGNIPNFGDELNPYIFSGLFDTADFESQFKNHILMGVGSILSPSYFDRIQNGEKAVVFGSGIRDPDVVVPQSKLSVVFVRGAISARALQCGYITDGAYLLAFLKEYEELLHMPKQYRISLMPYYRHIGDLDWERIASRTGAHIILPSWPVLKILRHIAQSESIFSGAMHGCIVADILRIPWARMQFNLHENDKIVQHVKWLDWCSSINVANHRRFSVVGNNSRNRNMNTEIEDEICTIITSKIHPDEFSLSEDKRFNSIKIQIHEAIIAFSKKFHMQINRYRTTGI